METNPTIVVHAIAALIVVVGSIPLMRRRVWRNNWYGFRLKEALVSDECWFRINEYGGRLLLRWAITLGLLSAGGTLFPRNLWVVYNLLALVVVIAGPAVIVVKVTKFARASEQSRRELG